MAFLNAITGKAKAFWNGTIFCGRWIMKRVQFAPFWRTGAELFFAAAFTFFPFLLLSTPLAQASGTLNSASVGSKFWSYFDSGEIALPILSLCGSIIAVAFTRRRALNEFLFFLALSMSILIAIIASYAIGVSEEFTEVLYPLFTWTGFTLYGALLLLWGILGFTANIEKETGNPEDRAQKLLEQARQVRARSSK